jgi:integrase
MKQKQEQDYGPQVLTDLRIKNFKPRSNRTEVRDLGTENQLYLLIQPSGHRSFALRYEVGGQSRKLTLGTWREDKKADHLSLARARVMAEDARDKIARGIDPAGEKRDAKTARREAEANTLQAVAEDFLKRKAGMKIGPNGVTFDSKTKMRSGPAVYATLQRLVFPSPLGKLPIGDIKRKTHITALLDKIEDKNGVGMAQSVLAILRSVLNWYAGRDEDFVSPIVRGMARTSVKERARSRILADDEIRDLWAALDTAAVPECYPNFMRLLLYTGVRRCEASDMTAAEIRSENGKGDFWVIPGSRYKQKHDHVVPLTKQAMALIEDGNAPFIFSTTGGTKAFRGFSAAKKALDAEIARIRKRDGRPPIERWTTHDLRRSARSLMSRAKVDADIAERAIGHAIPGVRATYDHHSYFEEKRDALERLAALLDHEILNPTPDNVVKLKTGSRD